MAEEIAGRSENATVHAAGAQLRAAREEMGLSLEDVAAETRIPRRHLTAIEESDFASLPARTYAIGFSRTYAKVVGLDQDAIAQMVRAELDAHEPERPHRPATFEPGDPARVPSARLGWFAAIAALLLLAGGFFFFRSMFSPAAELPSLVEQQEREQAAQVAATETPAEQSADAAAAAADGPVVFTATDEAWVRFEDANGTLFERVMSEGETYTVPQDAQQPVLRTGRPDALAITVAGREVPRISEQQRVVSGVPVTPESLLSR